MSIPKIFFDYNNIFTVQKLVLNNSSVAQSVARPAVKLR